MHEPVTAADGQTYEREALKQWLVTHKDSPWTKADIQDLPVYDNIAVKKATADWLETHPDSEGTHPCYFCAWVMLADK